MKTNATTDRFQAMGSVAHIEINGEADLLETARRRLSELERRWSRFLPDSEISRCNSTRGIPVFVSADTRRLVRHGVAAWRRTGGRCDPSVLDAVIAAGYDRSFQCLLTDDSPRPHCLASAAPGCAGIEVDDGAGSVTLPVGTGFDPGAIGKGLAADLVVEELMNAGATGVFLSIGGDLRAEGRPQGGDGWQIPIEEPSVSPDRLGSISLAAGAVATSTDRKRRWHHRGVERHHVIDPTTGAPSTGDAALVTAITGAAWWAEALATRLLLSPSDTWSRLVGDDGALIVDIDGGIHIVGRMTEHVR